MAEYDDIPDGICRCGCGQPTKWIPGTNRPRGLVVGTYYKFKKGHARRGLPTNSYRAARQPNGDLRLIHQVRAEKALGRPLPPGAHVHHVDEDPWNPNARLVICEDQTYHGLLHRRTRIVRAGGNPNTDKICCGCKAVLPKTDFDRYHAAFDGRQATCRKCLRLRVLRKREQQCLVKARVLS